MGSVVAGAGVNPSDQRWGLWPLLPLCSQTLLWIQRACPRVGPHFLCNWVDRCATKAFFGIEHGQASGALTQVSAATNYFPS